MRELTMNEVQDVNGGFGWIVVAIAAALLGKRRFNEFLSVTV
jgi:lactobin A/cerein 7B family class IIb bacteriocin